MCAGTERCEIHISCAATSVLLVTSRAARQHSLSIASTTPTSDLFKMNKHERECSSLGGRLYRLETKPDHQPRRHQEGGLPEIIRFFISPQAVLFSLISQHYFSLSSCARSNCVSQLLQLRCTLGQVSDPKTRGEGSLCQTLCKLFLLVHSKPGGV